MADDIEERRRYATDRICLNLGFKDVVEFRASEPDLHDHAIKMLATPQLMALEADRAVIKYIEFIYANRLTSEQKAEIALRLNTERPQLPNHSDMSAVQTQDASTQDDLDFTTDEISEPSPDSVENPEQACVYTDAQLKKLVVDYLKENRLDEFTYTQANKVFKVDYRRLDTLLGNLAKDDGRIIKFFRKGTKLYKYAPERKLITQDVSRTTEIAAKAIAKFLLSNPHSNSRSIRKFASRFFGYIDHSTVDDVVNQLVENGWVTVVRGAKNAKLHCANPNNQPSAT